MVDNPTALPAPGISQQGAHPLHVVLVGNYPRDGQQSMQRFADAMLIGLRQRGVVAELILPEVLLGRRGASAHSGLGKWLGYLDKFVIFPRQLMRVIDLRLRSLDPHVRTKLIVHVCDHSNATYTRCLQRVAHVVTCHDLLAVRSARGEIPQNPTGWLGRRLQAMILRGLNRAQHIACVSKTTASDVLRLTKLGRDAVSVISNSLNFSYSPMAPADALSRLRELCAPGQGKGPESGYILHVGGNQWYKNRFGVLQVYARLAASGGKAPALVMVGEPFTPEMEAFIATKRLDPMIYRIQSCSSEDLRALYASAGALLFPSLAEGFGWPVIEAQACGCPVVCSRVGPVPDIAGDGACLVESGDEPGFVEAIQRLITDPNFREQMIERGSANAAQYQPERMIGSYLDCYSKLISPAGIPSTARSRILRTPSSLPA